MNLLYRRNIIYPQQIYFRWLTKATMQAILGAFGVDGTAVIKATNAYLNQLAASGQAGKDKATSLAALINEDPMTVCSLGLSVEGVTMPIRRLQGDGKAYINTGYVVKATDRISIKGYMPNGGAPSTFFGWRWDGSFNDDYQAYLIFNNSPGLFIVGSRSKIGANKSIPYGVEFEAIVDFKNHIRQYKYSGITVDDSATADFVSPISQNTPAYVMGFNTNGASYGYPPVGYITDADLTGWHGVPCKHNGQNGLYDIEGMTWHGNDNSEGQFTIPDISYTPSTP